LTIDNPGNTLIILDIINDFGQKSGMPGHFQRWFQLADSVDGFHISSLFSRSAALHMHSRDRLEGYTTWTWIK
jgi:hypothetical protein